MLTELHIEDFALIGDLTVRFGPGITVLTGETGAGKSIIIDALLLALGNRASADQIRTGASRSAVEAVFILEPGSAPVQLLRQLELLDEEQPDQLILAREVHRNGRHRCRVNGRLVGLSVLAEIGQTLVDWLGQNEHQSLLRRERHQALLDRFAGPAAVELAAQVEASYLRWQELQSQLRQVAQDHTDHQHLAERLAHEMQEIDQAAIAPGEEEELAAEEQRLRHAAQLVEASRRAYQLLYEQEAAAEGELPAAVDLVGQAVQVLNEAVRIDPALQAPLQLVLSAQAELGEAAHQLRRYQQQIVLDPQRLEEVSQRLDLIRRLLRKYGGSLAALQQYRRQAEEQWNNLVHRDERREELGRQAEAALAHWRELAAQLSRLRREAVARLGAVLPGELQALALPHARIEAQLTPLADPSPRGAEQVEFYLSANPGQPLQPLARVASGGELSRVSLALKTVLLGADDVATLVFDEVEAGVGGRALLQLAERLLRLACHHQVLCVTHAPVLAAWADQQIRVDKQVVDGQTQVVCQPVNGPDRLAELVRMLGAEDTGREPARQYAERLLQEGARRRQAFQAAHSQPA
ncbi:MAG: DNA repair protein RecN [Limnochordaceae bacterium]|nr:DNA repair protein RecN [Limnochordaceae bacterium]